jgi:hypothetical protein
MFSSKKHKNKKGVYDTGLKSKNSVSMQIAKEKAKLNKLATKPKKAAKKEAKILAKKKEKMQKQTAKFKKKKHLKIKIGKSKSDGAK